MDIFSNIQVLVAITLLPVVISQADECKIDRKLQGTWVGLDRGSVITMRLDSSGMGVQPDRGAKPEQLTCHKAQRDQKVSTVLFHSRHSDCYVCYKFWYRTENVVEYQRGSCGALDQTMETLCNLRYRAENFLFRDSTVATDCRSIVEGFYRFTYDVRDHWMSGTCHTAHSVIYGCPWRGSPYVKNNVFDLHFGDCDRIKKPDGYYRYSCLGTWTDEANQTLAAIRNLGEESYAKSFRCLTLTRSQTGTILIKMSRHASCNTLHYSRVAPITLTLHPEPLIDDTYYPYNARPVDSTCEFPVATIRQWLQSEAGEEVTSNVVNEDQVVFTTLASPVVRNVSGPVLVSVSTRYIKIKGPTYDTYIACKASDGSNIIVTEVDVGSCGMTIECLKFSEPQIDVPWTKGQSLYLNTNYDAVPDGFPQSLLGTLCV